MRNGNNRCKFRQNYLFHSSYRTYEEWKPPFTNTQPYRQLWFLPYLWGMETYGIEVSRPVPSFVLTVPMRNGNGWKESHGRNSWTVLTVPMRNGNNLCCNSIISFLSVLTVPMRNGNFAHAVRTGCFEIVLTVPMRNGNSANINLVHEFLPFLPYLWGMETVYIERFQRF